jgi:hypothetical protein
MTPEDKARLDDLNRQLAAKDASIQQLQSAAVTPSAGGKSLPSWWSVGDAMTISSAVLIFAVIVLGLTTYVIRAGRNPEAVLRVFGTILIVLAAVFLVVAGYTDTQIAPVMGLLGTIAGYLLGKDPKPSQAIPTTPPDSP